jgi:hypothetical protein
MRTANGPRMCTNENREGTRLRQAYGAARYEWTRMNGREKAQKAQKILVRSVRFAVQETHKR